MAGEATPAVSGSPEPLSAEGHESPGGLSAQGRVGSPARAGSDARRTDGRPSARGPEGAHEPMRGALGGLATARRKLSQDAAVRGEKRKTGEPSKRKAGSAEPNGRYFPLSKLSRP